MYSVTTGSPTTMLDTQQLLHVQTRNCICLQVDQSKICRAVPIHKMRGCQDCVQLAWARLLQALRALSR